MLQLEIVMIPNQSNQDEQTGETLLVTKENESWKSISSLLDRNLIISESDVTNAFLWENASKTKKYDILTRQWAMFDPTDTHSYHSIIVQSIKESYFENDFKKIQIL